MMVVIAALEARLANLGTWADEALQLWLVDYLSLAASAFEGPIRFDLCKLADSQSRFLG